MSAWFAARVQKPAVFGDVEAQIERVSTRQAVSENGLHERIRAMRDFG